MDKLTLAKQLNKKYQEINTQKDYKGNRTLLEWEHVPATDRVVWERMAEYVQDLLNEQYNFGVKCLEAKLDGFIPDIINNQGENVTSILEMCVERVLYIDTREH